MMRLMAPCLLALALSMPSVMGDLTVVTGSYTGTGNSLAITSLGIAPELCSIMGAATGREVVFAADNWGGNDFHADSGTSTGYVSSLDADGFTVGTDAQTNANTETYYYWCVEGTDVVTGSYTGTGAAANITVATGHVTEFVWIFRADAATDPRYWATNHTTSGVLQITSGGFTSDSVTGTHADGFSLGTSVTVNNNTTTHYYFSFDAADSTYFDSGGYTGDGVDNTDITAPGFQPEVVFVKMETSFAGAVRAGMSGDLTKVGSGSATSANYIQDLISTGFEIGSHASVNQDTSPYQFIAFTDSPASNSVPLIQRHYLQMRNEQ